MGKRKLYLNTVSELLIATLNLLASADEFKNFRLVGGTSLSLQLGHRISVDIDLFSDAAYKSIDFKAIDTFLKNNFLYVDSNSTVEAIGIGTSYFVGKSENECIKLDIYYTDTFVFPIVEFDLLKLASIEEIIAMKFEIIGTAGRKKDFWDIHEVIHRYSFSQMFEFYNKRYPYSRTKEEIKGNINNFALADEDFDPICLRGKYWELIKLDIIEWAQL